MTAHGLELLGNSIPAAAERLPSCCIVAACCTLHDALLLHGCVRVPCACCCCQPSELQPHALRQCPHRFSAVVAATHGPDSPRRRYCACMGIAPHLSGLLAETNQQRMAVGPGSGALVVVLDDDRLLAGVAPSKDDNHLAGLRSGNARKAASDPCTWHACMLSHHAREVVWGCCCALRGGCHCRAASRTFRNLTIVALRLSNEERESVRWGSQHGAWFWSCPHKVSAAGTFPSSSCLPDLVSHLACHAMPSSQTAQPNINRTPRGEMGLTTALG